MRRNGGWVREGGVGSGYAGHLIQLSHPSETPWLKQKFISSQLWKLAAVHGQCCGKWVFWSGSTSWLIDGFLLAVCSYDLFFLCLLGEQDRGWPRSPVSVRIRPLSLLDQGPILMTSFIIICPHKGTICTYTYIGIRT